MRYLDECAEVFALIGSKSEGFCHLAIHTTHKLCESRNMLSLAEMCVKDRVYYQDALLNTELLQKFIRSLDILEDDIYDYDKGKLNKEDFEKLKGELFYIAGWYYPIVKDYRKEVEALNFKWDR